MIYVKFANHIAVALATADQAQAFWQQAKCDIDAEGNGFQNRNDWKSWERAVEVAADLTKSLGVEYMAVDKGHHVSPRFDVIKAPVIGDLVSKCFNGDCYPCGAIKTISPTGYIITNTEGERFFRQGKSGSWQHQGWSLVPGHVNKLNPEF